MAKRNTLFNKMVESLADDHGMAHDESSKLAKRALVENRQNKKVKGAGGQSGKTRPVTVIEDACEGIDPECDKETPFRTITGQCNNLDDDRHYWGAMSIPFLRLIEVDEYNPKVAFNITGAGVDGGDYLGRKASSNNNNYNNNNQNNNDNNNNNINECIARATLPSARSVSVNFHHSSNDVDIASTEVTHMVTQWGQFLDHDITLTPEHEEHDCCHLEFNATDNCFPIEVDTADSFYSIEDVSCLEFTRSVAYCEENGGTRQQLNGITSFIDASNVYGSDEDTAAEIRSFIDGKLLVQTHDLLPIIDEDGFEVAGDVRALEMPGLATMHTLFVREHNRLCDLIKAEKPDMEDEEVYQNARRILIAEYQSVVYGGYLPVVLGEKNMDGLTLEEDGSNYDDDAKPDMTNEFATAAYRFGHSMIQGIIQMFKTDNTGLAEQYQLHENFFNTENYYQNDGEGMEQILMGLVTQPALAFDREATTEIANLLFPEEGASFGTDLLARNIQRGRDHGLPSFCCYYQLYDDDKHDCSDGWEKRYHYFSQDDWALLQTIYTDPNDIDLFTGGLAQKPEGDSYGLTGKVFNAMKGMI